MSETVCVVVGCDQEAAKDFVCEDHSNDLHDPCPRRDPPSAVGPAIWPETCPRCQQLAALEAEIGRLQIGAMMVSSLDDIVSDVSVVNNSPHNPHLWTHLWCLIEKEQDGLITRWRKLRAEGAEDSNET